MDGKGEQKANSKAKKTPALAGFLFERLSKNNSTLSASRKPTLTLHLEIGL
jgi:hypothetical protein